MFDGAEMPETKTDTRAIEHLCQSGGRLDAFMDLCTELLVLLPRVNQRPVLVDQSYFLSRDRRIRGEWLGATCEISHQRAR